jgi:hypothetical protein
MKKVVLLSRYGRVVGRKLAKAMQTSKNWHIDNGRLCLDDSEISIRLIPCCLSWRMKFQVYVDGAPVVFPLLARIRLHFAIRRLLLAKVDEKL